MANPYVNDQGAKTAAALGRLLADSYLIYVKTQGFHWNVIGSQFEPLHDLFQRQYTELAKAIDETAERIRALGVKAPGSFSELNEHRPTVRRAIVIFCLARLGSFSTDSR